MRQKPHKETENETQRNHKENKNTITKSSKKSTMKKLKGH